MSALPDTIGVVGAGIMGRGIAQLAAQTGARTVVYDAAPGAATTGIETIRGSLQRLVERGRLSPGSAAELSGRLEPVADLGALEFAGMVIEAAPEQLELKHQLFAALADIVAADCVLASNTSSLSITEIAAATPGPERVVGLHFFNPPPVMRLVEVVAGERSGESALARTRAVGEAMGKRVIDATDVAGFLVNRSARPFSLIALRLLQERICDHRQLDRIARLEGGFRMGPLELMDLVGLDTNFAVAQAFQRQSFGEPRYQPSAIQARMVAAGRLGRKTGSGWYDYAPGTAVGEYRPVDEDPPVGGGGGGRVVRFAGADVQLPVAVELMQAAGEAGFAMQTGSPDASADVWLTLVFGDEPGTSGPRARFLHDGSLHALDPAAAGFHVMPPVADARLIELAQTPLTDPLALERLTEFVAATGRHCEHVRDVPGLVLGRIVACLINEAGFTIGEGNGAAVDIDAGVELGLNHPRGPVAWSHAAGVEHVVALLDALRRELGEERYRVAPELRRAAALGASGL